MARRVLSVDRRLQRLESLVLSAGHTAENDLQRQQDEWHTRFLHALTVAELKRLDHWYDGHLGDTEGREVAKWYEALVQTYVDRTGDSPPKLTMGESS
jgi:hypothetical protein